MSHEPPEFRYYKTEGPALDLLKAYAAEIDALAEGRQKLEHEIAERYAQLSAHRLANLQSLWARLAASVGLNPDDTWGSPEYQIETRFIDDGFGAILYTPRHANPMQAALESEPVAERSDPETDIPPKETTRH